MATVSVDPRYHTFRSWASSAILEAAALLPDPVAENQWRAWAASVAQIDGTAPDPRPFDDWRAWATAWVGA